MRARERVGSNPAEVTIVSGGFSLRGVCLQNQLQGCRRFASPFRGLRGQGTLALPYIC